MQQKHMNEICRSFICYLFYTNIGRNVEVARIARKCR